MDNRRGQLSPELARLRDALNRNGRTEGGTGLLMGRDTSFAGTVEGDLDEGPDAAINAVKSVPVHY